MNKLSNQFSELIGPCLHNPVRFVYDVIQAQPDPWQEAALMSLVEKKRVAIAGCNGSGKDVLAVWAALWALCTKPFCKGQVTGPNKIQVFDTVWPEAKKWIDHSPILPHLITWTKTRLAWKEAPDRWFISARTAAKRYSAGGTGDVATEGIQGMHAEHLIIIITEASGVEDNNWEAAESCCTQPDNYLMAVGNPLRRSGRFYDIFTKTTYAGWVRRHVSHKDSAWVDKARVKEWIERYGVQSAFCQVRCFGRFPKEGDTDSAIPWDMVQAAMERREPLNASDSKDLQLGVDVARYGGDEFVIAVRRGLEIVEILIWQKISGSQMEGVIVQALKDHGGNKETPVIIDEAGLGSTGPVDHLLNMGYNVIGVTNSGTAVNEERYAKWDDEQWMETLHEFLKVGKLPLDDTLLAQLTTRRYEFTGRNEQQRRLESKKQMRSRGIQSPDRAEAVMMACAPPASWGALHEHDAHEMYWSKYAGAGAGAPVGGGHTPWGTPKALDPGMADRAEDDEDPGVSSVLDGMLR